MTKRYRIRPKADIDLDSIWSFIAADNGKAADATIDRIIDTFEMLPNIPFVGRARSEFGDNLRSIAVGNYIVFYATLPDGVEIVRVMHGRQDIDADDMA